LGTAGQLDSNGGLLSAGGGRFSLTCLTCLTCLTKMGAPRYTLWVCFFAIWFGSGDKLPLGTAGQLDGNGGLLSAGA